MSVGLTPPPPPATRPTGLAGATASGAAFLVVLGGPLVFAVGILIGGT